MIITLDGGTTNTRLRLFDGARLLGEVKSPVGSSSSDKTALFAAVREMLAQLLFQCGVSEKEIETVAVTGMATSEFGLYELPHLPAPCGLSELRAGMKRVSLPQVTSIPLTVIPGVKNAPEDAPDLMRGEEVECIGICRKLGIESPAVLMLPGTHNKLIRWDGARITACLTVMSGELIAALKTGTILRSSLPQSLPETFDEAALKAGAALSAQAGLGTALFRVRAAAKAGQMKEQALCGFFVGAVLEGDVRAAESFVGDLPVYVGGKEPLKSELCLLLKSRLTGTIIPVSDETARLASSLGALAVLE